MKRAGDDLAAAAGFRRLFSAFACRQTAVLSAVGIGISGGSCKTNIARPFTCNKAFNDAKRYTIYSVIITMVKIGNGIRDKQLRQISTKRTVVVGRKWGTLLPQTQPRADCSRRCVTVTSPAMNGCQ